MKVTKTQLTASLALLVGGAAYMVLMKDAPSLAEPPKAIENTAAELGEDMEHAEPLPVRPLADLGKLELHRALAQSDEEVRRLYPGAHREQRQDVSYVIDVEHPWFQRIVLGWLPDGLHQLELIATGTTEQRSLLECVEQALKTPPRITSMSNGEDVGVWDAPNEASVRVYPSQVRLEANDPLRSLAVSPDFWQSFVSSLDGCGRHPH